jgi:hypothetical protein
MHRITLRMPEIIFLLLASIILTGCENQSALDIEGKQLTPDEQQVLQASEKLRKQGENAERISAKDAFNEMKPKIDEALKNKNARLGKINGTNVNKDGEGTSWSFIYFEDIPGDKNNINEYFFGWTKKGVTSGSDKIFSMELDTPDYDYMFKGIEIEWDNYAQIAEKVFLETPKENNEWGLTMSLQWNTKISAGGPFWSVKRGSGATAEYFDGKSLEPL